MTSIDLAGLDNEGLFELLGTVHTEMASRERQHRKNLRDELENRQTAEGYKLADLFPQLARANAGRVPRRKLRAKFRNPHAPDDTWGNYIHDSTLWGGEVNGDRLNHPYGAVEGESTRIRNLRLRVDLDGISCLG